MKLLKPLRSVLRTRCHKTGILLGAKNIATLNTSLFPAINLAIRASCFKGLRREYQVDRQGFARPVREEGWRDTSRPFFHIPLLTPQLLPQCTAMQSGGSKKISA
uniref:Uncharacterized protein n=1 Tax=Cucumis sativus TaxID=3659 RepID=A0A0A0L2K1_CUCSA